LISRLGHQCTIEYVDESVSAYTDRTRPGYQRLLRHLRYAAAPTLIVWHLDRLYRRPEELEQLLDLLADHPTRIESVQGGRFDLNRHEGRLFARQLVAFANYESALKGARVARAHQQRAQHGLLHGGSHFGYRNNGKREPRESWIIRQIVDAYLTGLSVTAIAKELTIANIPSPTRRRRWGATTITSILRSDRLHQRRGSHDGAWEPIIDATESALIQALNLAPRRDSTRSSATLLGGMGRCGTCRSRLISAVTHRGQRIYRCTPRDGACGSMTADMARTDHDVTAWLTENRQHPHAPVVVQDPDLLLTCLSAATNELHERAALYATARIPQHWFHAAREHPVVKIDACVDELHRHIRQRIIRTHPDLANTFPALAITRQRPIVEAFAHSVTVHRGNVREGNRTHVEVEVRQ